jgi:hypothetical protein
MKDEGTAKCSVSGLPDGRRVFEANDRQIVVSELQFNEIADFLHSRPRTPMPYTIHCAEEDVIVRAFVIDGSFSIENGSIRLFGTVDQVVAGS